MSIYFYSELKKLKEHFSNSDIQYPTIFGIHDLLFCSIAALLTFAFGFWLKDGMRVWRRSKPLCNIKKRECNTYIKRLIIKRLIKIHLNSHESHNQSNTLWRPMTTTREFNLWDPPWCYSVSFVLLRCDSTSCVLHLGTPIQSPEINTQSYIIVHVSIQCFNG